MLISFKVLLKWPLLVHHPWVHDLNSSKPGLLKMKKHSVISKNTRCFLGGRRPYTPAQTMAIICRVHHADVLCTCHRNRRGLYLHPSLALSSLQRRQWLRRNIHPCLQLPGSCHVRFSKPALMFYLPTFQRQPGSLSAWFPFQCEANLLKV